MGFSRQQYWSGLPFGILHSHEKGIMPFAATWMDLENITLGEGSQTEKEILYDIT